MAPATLNLIGPGRLGRSLTRLWHDAGILTLQGVAGRRPAMVDEAIAFIGAGQAMTLANLPAADFTLLATPDDALPDIVAQLLQVGVLAADSVVLHASGALGSEVLAPLRSAGVWVASVHPLKSFAQPAQAIQDFAGTWCGCEGDAIALARLAPLFDGLGAHRFGIAAQHKTLYHAGAVLACNDLVALMEAALRCMAAAGVPREQAWPALRPLVQGTLANLDRLGTQAALTGPIARGDNQTVARQLAATQALDPAVAQAYRSLGQLALQLAQLDASQHQALAALLEAQP
ncbi:Rossmann-like and DUF2520 domain-containing protein [Chitinimonas sp. JJ19]|uniref:Rossmann-like and DUF2520 domain-containing protein n=1 Tax=Chitinimonas sp. JJ19 TaxID=3109352 RepID=UPI002FFE5B89